MNCYRRLLVAVERINGRDNPFTVCCTLTSQHCKQQTSQHERSNILNSHHPIGISVVYNPGIGI